VIQHWRRADEYGQKRVDNGILEQECYRNNDGPVLSAGPGENETPNQSKLKGSSGPSNVSYKTVDKAKKRGPGNRGFVTMTRGGLLGIQKVERLCNSTMY